MDLLSAKKEIVEQSRQDKKKTFFIDVDDEGECSISTTFTKNHSCAAYRNGSEIALPEDTIVPDLKLSKGKKAKIEKGVDENAGPVTADDVSLKPKKEITKPVKEGMSNKTTAGAVKPEKKMATKTKAKGKPSKAKKAVAVKKAAGAMPEGKRQTLTIKKAIELAKKGAMIYRASNGSAFGLYYLEKVKNKDHAMDLIVRV